LLATSHVRPASTSRTRPAKPTLLKVNPATPLPQLQVTIGFQQPIQRNRNGKRQQRRHAHRQQTQKVRTTICPTDIERKAHACVPFEICKTREVCVWRPKHEAQEACDSEASPLKCDVQQCKVRVSSQRHETRVSMTECGTQRIRVSQMSLAECDNQQREVRISSP